MCFESVKGRGVGGAMVGFLRLTKLRKSMQNTCKIMDGK